MDVIRTLSAGTAGTKRFQEIYGDQLVCVRYRQDSSGKKYTTIELIVAERTSSPQPTLPENPGNNRFVYLRIGYHETELRNRVKTAGGRWDAEKKLWQLRRRHVTALGLQHRIVQI